MRIDGFQNIPAILQSFKTDKSSQKNAENETPSQASSVSLSSFAEILQAVQRQVAQEALARGARVSQLTEQVQSGKLNVDISKLAEKLIDLQVIDIKD